MCDSQELIDDTIILFSDKFEIENLGFPTRFLGIDVTINSNMNISLNQSSYIKKILKKFQMDELNEISTPILKNHHYDQLKSIKPANFGYKNALGNLMYLANHTRPGITFAVHFLALLQMNPKPIHFVMIKRIFRYLSVTGTLGLTFDQNSDHILDTYVDASYKDDPMTSKSTTGYLIQYHENTIAWKSRIQRTFARSTGQAEYIAVCDATEDILFIGRLIKETLELNNVLVTRRQFSLYYAV